MAAIDIGYSQDLFECTWSRVGGLVVKLVGQGGFERIWSGQWLVWMMTMMVRSCWDENEVARRCCGGPGTIINAVDLGVSLGHLEWSGRL